MKVLLLQPYKIVNAPIGGPSYPLGQAYIAAGLIKSGINVNILDCYLENSSLVSYDNNTHLHRIGLSDDDIQNIVTNLNPDIVGISINFSIHLKASLAIASLLKSKNDKLIIAAGGAHVSAVPESLNDSDFDFLVVGEGEEIFPKLVNSLCRNPRDFESLPGVYYRDSNGNFITNIPREFIKNLDDIPFPAYNLMPFKKIWTHKIPYANIIATRGCPYNCGFCSIHAVMGRNHRRRSIENILYEIKILVNKYGVKEIFFEDDNVTVNLDWAKQLFEKISQQPYKIELGFRNGIRADRVDKELLVLMHRAGCARVCFAPESGSQPVLNSIIDKSIRLEDVENSVIMARYAGLNVTCFFVIGIPGETKQDIQKTVQYADKLRKLGCDAVDINCFVPYPGTRLYRHCLEKGIINDNLDWSKLHTHESIINTEEFSARDIMMIQGEAMSRLQETKAEKYIRGIKNLWAFPLEYSLRKLRKRNCQALINSELF